jgi:hypothetical protein
MLIETIEECHHEACIRNGSHFRENPLRDERSGGPSIDPQSCM